MGLSKPGAKAPAHVHGMDRMSCPGRRLNSAGEAEIARAFRSGAQQAWKQKQEGPKGNCRREPRPRKQLPGSKAGHGTLVMVACSQRNPAARVARPSRSA
jgi:hypothetical protein